MESFTNITTHPPFVSELAGPGYVVFSVVFLILVLLPTTAVNAVIVVFLLVDKTTAKFMRLVLANIPIACSIVSVGLAINLITGLHLNVSKATPPDNGLCRFITVIIAFGGTARLLFMTAFAATVFIIVRCQKWTKHSPLVFAGVISLWILTLAGTAPLFSDEIVITFFSDNVSCGPAPVGLGSYLYICLYLLLFGICTFATTITLLILTVCYIRNNSITDGEMKKAMLKLGFFLLLGNFINILGQIVPPLIAAFLVAPENAESMNYGNGNASLIYFSYAMLNLSLIPPPILVLIYFKPIMVTIRKWIFCGRHQQSRSRKSSHVISSHLAHEDVIVTNKM